MHALFEESNRRGVSLGHGFSQRVIGVGIVPMFSDEWTDLVEAL